MNFEYKTISKTDYNIFRDLKKITDELELKDTVNITVTVGQNYTVTKVIPLNSDVENTDISIWNNISLQHFILNNNPQNYSININRVDNFLKITINDNQSNSGNYDNIKKVISTFQKYFLPFEANKVIEEYFGKEIEKYYQSREATLQRLETLSVKQVEENAKLRKSIEDEGIENQKKLEEDYGIKKSKLEEDYNKLVEELRVKEEKLKKRESELDDRSSKHARRQIRQELKYEIQKRSSEFTLSRGTINKRLGIHGTCIFFILSLSFLIYKTLGIEAKDTYYYVKQGSLSITLAFTIIYYTKWNDNWFKRHADEEFILKRLELDIDRASWVVEMAMEWKSENNNEDLPEELLNRLTANLFQENSSPKVTHPTEDIITKLLGESSELNLNTPLGSAKFDRRAVKRGAKEIKKVVGE